MLKIYGVPPSIHTRKVIVAALEKQIPYEIEFVFPFDPPPGWRERSPTGKIPAVTDEGFHLADSSVIVAYLEKKFPQHPLFPSTAREYGQALWFEEVVDSSVAPDITAIFHQRILNPMLYKKPADETAIAGLLNEHLPPKFEYLETSLPGEYLVGQNLTIADITLASDLLIYHYLGYTLAADRYPKLVAHFDRMLRRSSFQTALRAEQSFAEQMGLERGFLRGVIS